jgi:two-component system, sensor histidine kinase PdtaS
VSALSDLLSSRTTLNDEQIAHLQRLAGEWQLLSDLAFADLLLWVPVAIADGEAGSVGAFLCAAQCRPTTGPTAHQHDQVGMLARGERAVPMRTAYSERRTYRDAEPDWDGDLPIRREAIPIRLDGPDPTVFAILGKDANLASVRTPSQLELVYLQTAADLSAMVADGTFPNPDANQVEGSGPRVGDGLLRLEPDGTILYASPNSLSAFSRLGISGSVVGEALHELTTNVADDPFDVSDLGDAVQAAIDGGQPASIEVDAGGATVMFRAIPLRPRGETLGALLLMQDVTELRRRDRQILSKEATIREIHHRVKNNLQTVAALLRLQARRVAVPEARAALEESMRRVSSIALVHETLSVSVAEQVDFDEVVDRLLVMLADVTGAGGRITLRREGTFGEIPAEVATGLVLVITELVQNALEHAFPDAACGSVSVVARRSRGELSIAVDDDGRGLPEGFSSGAAEQLGLQIVRTLVSAELDGTVDFSGRAQGTGTSAHVRMRLGRRARVGG